MTAQAPAPASSQTSFDDRIPALDGIRGLALIQVLLIHYAILNEVRETTAVDRFFEQVWQSGWIAMDSFFVLSGFLITGILYEAKAGVPHFFRNFYARRSLRIFPAYYLYLLLLLVLLPIIMPAQKNAIHYIRHDWWWFWGYIGNIRLAMDEGRRADVFFTSHLWSLAVEEQFYIVWPVFVLLLSRAKLMAFCIAISITALAIRIGMVLGGVNAWVPYELTITRMDSLAIGSMVALIVRDRDEMLRLKRWLPTLAIGAAILVAVPALIRGELYIFGGWEIAVDHTALSILYGLLIFSIATGARGTLLDKIFGNRVLVKLGRYSYAMYLWHLAIAWYLNRQFSIGTHIPTLFGSHLPGALTFALAAFIPTYIVGALSWKFIEGPALRLKRFFPYTAGEDAARHTAAPARAPIGASDLDQRGSDHVFGDLVPEQVQHRRSDID